jgi:ADP-heptose:LPS heptosyltransferase
MGFGDHILTTAIVRRAATKHPGKKIAVGDGTRIIWSEVFDGNPHLTREVVPDCIWVHDSPGRRPYIREIHDWGYVFNKDYRAEPGELFLEGWGPVNVVYIEPNVKGSNTVNKDWGFDHWQRVVDTLPDVDFIQGRGRRLAGVAQYDTASFRDACGLLLHADFFVGTDGGLHHAAAAIGKRAVVLWSGFVNPEILGYETHVNLCEADTFCGRFASCSHCQSAMERIKVETVVEAIRSLHTT